MTKPLSVLLIEDNPGDAELTREILEERKLRVAITVVDNGPDALAYLLRQAPHVQAELPDLILLDLNLPRMDGRQVLSEIKKHADLCTIPVVILTSSDAERDIVKSYALGANCYVTKPVGLEAFQTIVRDVEKFWLTVVKLP
ncbi:MAG TPA: response regulator [Acetobacteraceae bacterium]|nr:response regulator [Acetobacteraceae bacterium]